MKIALVWYYNKASDIFLNWRDGVRGAVDELNKEHQVEWFLDKTLPTEEDGFDVILIWDDSNTAAIQYLTWFTGKKGLLLTTDPHNIENLKNFDVIYCESQPVYDAVRRNGLHAVRAFGTDTDFFTPDETVEKSVDYFYPATFSPWKLQREIAHLGPKLTCIGTIQPDGMFDYQACVDNAVNVKNGYFPVSEIRDYYRMSRRVIIPAIHGSERTVLEAMACNVFPEVTNDGNIRTKSLVEEYVEWRKGRQGKDKSPRTFVVENYSHKKYAQDILKGLQ
jgi:hypothetical protein